MQTFSALLVHCKVTLPVTHTPPLPLPPPPPPPPQREPIVKLWCSYFKFLKQAVEQSILPVVLHTVWRHWKEQQYGYRPMKEAPQTGSRQFHNCTWVNGYHINHTMYRWYRVWFRYGVIFVWPGDVITLSTSRVRYGGVDRECKVWPKFYLNYCPVLTIALWPWYIESLYNKELIKNISSNSPLRSIIITLMHRK